MTDTPSEPTTEQRDVTIHEDRNCVDSYDVAPPVPYVGGEFKTEQRELEVHVARNRVDFYDVAPPVPYDGEFKPLMGAYEPAPDPQPAQPAPTSSAGEE